LQRHDAGMLGQTRRLACLTGTNSLSSSLMPCGSLSRGDAEPLKSMWSHRDDVTIFGGWGAYEQGWAAVEPRLDWAASRYSEGWLDRENLLEGVDQDIAYSVDIERSGGRFDNAPEVREAPLRVTHLFRREEGQWRIVHRHADFLRPRQEPG
jgi:ketosteroid isomerase-like protein